MNSAIRFEAYWLILSDNDPHTVVAVHYVNGKLYDILGYWPRPNSLHEVFAILRDINTIYCIPSIYVDTGICIDYDEWAD